MILVYEEDSFVIANKPHGLPTVPLKKNPQQDTLLSRVGLLCPKVLEVVGKNEWERGALHRLDTDTSGLVVFAKTQEFYDYLLKEQAEGRFVKTYRADTDGDTEETGISSYFRSFGEGRRKVKVEMDYRKADSPILYTTTISKKERGVYMCTITRGFRHQIRSHLSYLSCPIKGDKLYNPSVLPTSTEPLMLDCQKVSFFLPDGRVFTFDKTTSDRLQ